MNDTGVAFLLLLLLITNGMANIVDSGVNCGMAAIKAIMFYFYRPI